MSPPLTRDGRYLIVDGVLWRATDPGLDASTKAALVKELMSARRAVKDALRTGSGLDTARSRVHRAKVALGERGPVWWTDGAPDLNRQRVVETQYAPDAPASTSGGRSRKRASR